MSLSSCTRYIHVMEQLRQSSGSMTRPRWDAPIMLYRMGAVVPGLLNSTMRQIAWTPVLVNMRPIIRPTILADTRITRDGHGNAISGRNIARCIMVCVSRKRTPYSVYGQSNRIRGSLPTVLRYILQITNENKKETVQHDAAHAGRDETKRMSCRAYKHNAMYGFRIDQEQLPSPIDIAEHGSAIPLNRFLIRFQTSQSSSFGSSFVYTKYAHRGSGSARSQEVAPASASGVPHEES